MIPDSILQLIVKALILILGMIENHLEVSRAKISPGGVSPSVTPMSDYNK